MRVYFPYKGATVPLDCFVDDCLHEGTVFQGLDKYLERFKKQAFTIADDYLDNRSFNLLIGLDNYYSLVHPGYRRQGDLILFPTKFGYALSGTYNHHAKVNCA